MKHIYFSLVAVKEELVANKFIPVQTADGQKIFVPVLYIESDNKDKIRKELIESIDRMLERI